MIFFHLPCQKGLIQLMLLTQKNKAVVLQQKQNWSSPQLKD